MANSADPDQLASSDLDLHCLQRQGISRFSRTRVDKSQTVNVCSGAHHVSTCDRLVLWLQTAKDQITNFESKTSQFKYIQ